AGGGGRRGGKQAGRRWGRVCKAWARSRRHCQRSRAFGCSAYRQTGTAEIHRRGPKMRPTFFGRARGRPGAALNSGQNGPELAFPATIALGRGSISIEDQNIKLSPGMTVTVEIKTGTRRIVSYLLSPLNELV